MFGVLRILCTEDRGVRKQLLILPLLASLFFFLSPECSGPELRLKAEQNSVTERTLTRAMLTTDHETLVAPLRTFHAS